ncbi:MAG: TetR/AcrR family transcriptional regulator [Ilumatobacteraceae bacterium]|nr:TetR/AcrR family transcriptional regulator [Ilumatobacteraceae bacterium]
MVNPGSATPDRILDAAERLFAERGIDGTTVSAIIDLAGAKNKSAVAYHFGSKPALLEAVLTPHLAAIDVHREALLDAIDASGTATLEQLVAALVVPVAAKLETPSGVRYLQIQASLLGFPNRAALPVSIIDPRNRFRRLDGMMATVTLGGPHVDANRMLIAGLVFHGLADFARLPRPTRRQRDEFVLALTDAVVAILRADDAAR